jgi:hypothetical protein
LERILSEIDGAEYQNLTNAVLAVEKAVAGNPNIRQDVVAALTEPNKRRLEALDQRKRSPKHLMDEVATTGA